jgi:hypothetical protein
MTKEQILIEFSEILKEDDIIRAAGIHEENFSPHQFTISPKHVKASDKVDGVMTEDICQKYPCAVKGCNLPYEEHNADRQLVLQLKRDITQDEAREQLLKLNSKIQELGIKTVAFADSDEGYEFIQNEKLQIWKKKL